MDGTDAMRDALLAGLSGGVWRQGHRLPTERQLSETYGIGRSAVRRVLAQLKEKGLVTQTVGSGTYVADVADVATAARPDGGLTQHTSPHELMESRLVLEPAICELVIRHATVADLASIERCCDESEAATSLEAFEHWDREFHERVARAAHNAFVLQLFETMGKARLQAEWGMLKRRSVTPERRLHYQEEHRAILHALKDRDLATAASSVKAHLLHVRRNLFGEPDPAAG